MKKLIGQTHPNWEDMSPFVVHFTKKSATGSEYNNSISILASRCLQAQNRFGMGKNYTESPPCVCFSEVPLLYAYQDTPHAKSMRMLIEGAVGKPDDPIWKIAPFVDQPGQYGSASYFFEWEREWRHSGNLAFKEEDPAFLIIPEDLHQAARDFFDNAEQEQLGRNYKCPFIDPYWGLEKIKGILKP
ncbi:hypothetical protein [Aquamicrobium sp. LC103]|uniref:hypothetical protein n=1 Tax=Aquamicrobium sp. LC103 TaxID=1120658 RepID=UPI00063EAD18|nr:hypothetical protein [Aquamicrobium sp. LC103]TKT81019.1 hypothetical protein XW59_003830 [Aquamicrobium sp. LC103]